MGGWLTVASLPAGWPHTSIRLRPLERDRPVRQHGVPQEGAAQERAAARTRAKNNCGQSHGAGVTIIRPAPAETLP
jgi:hypothetical protein